MNLNKISFPEDTIHVTANRYMYSASGNTVPGAGATAKVSRYPSRYPLWTDSVGVVVSQVIGYKTN